MDVKMVPKDPHGYRICSGMFDGHIYLIDPDCRHGRRGLRLETSRLMWTLR